MDDSSLEERACCRTFVCVLIHAQQRGPLAQSLGHAQVGNLNFGSACFGGLVTGVGSQTSAQIHLGGKSHHLDIRCGVTLAGSDTNSEHTSVVPGTDDRVAVIAHVVIANTNAEGTGRVGHADGIEVFTTCKLIPKRLTDLKGDTTKFG